MSRGIVRSGDARQGGGGVGVTVRGKDAVRRVGYAVNLTPETAKAAVDAGADLLVTHHGLAVPVRDEFPSVETVRLAELHDEQVRE